jgi:hypothetical protein
MVSFLPKLS